MELIDKDKRDGYIYDVVIKGFDTTFWKQTSGTSTVSGTSLRNNNAALASYIQHIFADAEFSLIVPVAPVAGQAKTWGFRTPSTDNVGAAYFEISGAVFTAVTKDENGNTKTTTITWDAAWTAAEVKYRILWEDGIVQFMINGVIVATHASPNTYAFPRLALPLRITNTNADNLDLEYIAVKRAAAII